MFELSFEQLFAFAAGPALALFLEYFPRLSDLYNGLEDNLQRLVVVGSGLLVVAGAFGLSCLELVTGLPACSLVGAQDLFVAFVLFIVSSQGVHRVLPR